MYIYRGELTCFLLVVVTDIQPTSTAPIQANGTTGWELALVTAPSSNESAAAGSKLVFKMITFSYIEWL